MNQARRVGMVLGWGSGASNITGSSFMDERLPVP
jgi:hypothetical protein